jgi:hypothetical protein
MHGNTALHLAVMLGRMECVQLLLAHGAPVKLKNRAGWSPLAEAIRSAACLEHFYGKREGSGSASASGSVLLTKGSGCGSGRPKNIRILRIRIRNTDSKENMVYGTICRS